MMQRRPAGSRAELLLVAAGHRGQALFVLVRNQGCCLEHAWLRHLIPPMQPL